MHCPTGMPRYRKLSVAVVLSPAVLALACGRTRPADVRPAAGDPCVLAAGATERDTVEIAVQGPVDRSHAPVPQTAAERVVFRHLYETLIRVDCEGRVLPALAEAWRAEQNGRRWIFTLRADAWFWDGAPVTAAAVKTSWLLHEDAAPSPWSGAAEGSVTVAGDRVLVVTLARPYPGVPRIFAHQGLAVARSRGATAAWPGGSAGHLVVSSDAERVIASPTTMGGKARPVLSFLVSRRDPRDLVDGGVDLLTTGDPAVLDYAVAAHSVRVVPLPWDVSYVLVARSNRGGGGPLATVTVAEQLAPAARGAEARAPAGSPWWAEAAASCSYPVWPATPSPAARSPRVIYERRDSAARGLAERVVALVASGGMRGVFPESTAVRPVAAGLGDRAYGAALSRGTDLGYVVALPRNALDRCTALASLLRRIPWATRGESRAVVAPLAETRVHAIVRGGVGTIAIDWDGTLHLSYGMNTP